MSVKLNAKYNSKFLDILEVHLLHFSKALFYEFQVFNF